MALPTKQKTWVISPNNRITFVSLIDTLSRLVFGLKTFLKASGGYTVKGSCDGTTGAMDGVDRIASQANFQTRATIAGASQSWIVLTDKSGCDILITYQGASDDIARISFSPGGLYLAAGTPAQQPTATDEQLFLSATSIVNATASADRVWHAWVSSDGKMFRVVVARSGVVAGPVWGVEIFNSVCVSPAVASPAAWGFAHGNTTGIASLTVLNATYSVNGRGGLARVVVSGTPVNIQVGGGSETFALAAATLAGINCELQGSQGPVVQSLSLYSATASARGKLGNRIDWWFSNDSQPDGTVTASKDFIMFTGSGSNSQGILWPWDSTTTPQMS
jgi:hypothetical protein